MMQNIGTDKKNKSEVVYTYIIEEMEMTIMNKDKNVEEKINACWLHAMYGVKRQKKHELLAFAGTVSEILALPKEQLKQFLTEKEMERWKWHEQHTNRYQMWEWLCENQIGFIYCEEEEFPQKMIGMPDMPFGLYYKGKLPDELKPSVAIVGARKNSEYGSVMADYFGRELANAGVEIISGMAMGIDGIGQKAALKAGGYSCGVLGCGVDIVYPLSNQNLYEQLLWQGGIVSEYPPGTQPLPLLFPQRNRIISALADVILVVEAREKSGTLITVDMALEQGRDVYVIPGRSTDALSMGCNKLLRQGAIAAITPQDILADMKWLNEETGEKQEAFYERRFVNLSETAQYILQFLDVTPRTQDDIMNKLYEKNCHYTIPQVCQGLFELELQGIAKRTAGLYSLSVTKL